MLNTEEHFGSFTAARDRRRHPRRTVSSLTYVKLDDTNGGIVLNISEDGLAMTAADVLVGEYLPNMRFQLPKCAQPIEASGKIVWLTESRKGAGIRFVSLSEEHRNQLRQWISSRRSPSEIQDASSAVRKSAQQMQTPSPRASRAVIPWVERVGEVEESQPEELFPSESSSRVRHEVKETKAASERPRPAIPQMSELAGSSISDIRWPFWSEQGELPPEPRSNKLSLVALVVVFIAISFAVGLVLGHGSFEGLLGRVQSMMPDKYQQAASTVTSPADAVGHSSPSAAPAPEQNADSATQLPAAPADPAPSAPASGNEGTQVTGTPLETSTPASGSENDAKTSDESSEPILVTPPSEGEQPFRFTVPEKAVSASSSVAVSSQASILVPPEAGSASFHQSERLQLGALIFYVEPQYPRGRDQTETEDIVKLRATVGENGQITNVERISGPMPLIPAAMSAVREWRYTPTLLSGRPIQTEEDITIEFRAH
jgi:hypothetical protein